MSMRAALTAAALAFVLTACGSSAPVASRQSPSPASSYVAANSPSATSEPSTASPTRTNSPSPPSTAPKVSPTLLFAALEAKGASTPYTWNTVAIAGLDGYARAKTTFTSMPPPYVGCAGAVLPTIAYAVAGKVYFSDSSGRIRSLSVGGQVTLVTTFPITSPQQMLSFAVSPDGARVLATVFTLPAPPSTGNGCTGGSMFGSGSFSLDVYAAMAGGAPSLLYHQDLPTSSTQPVPNNVLAFIGWDAVGPLATYPTEYATQGGGPSRYFGVPVRVDAGTGKVTAPVSDQNCSVWDIAATGDYVCEGPGAMYVRSPNGANLWQVTEPANSSYFSDLLSPDVRHVVCVTDSGTQVFASNGSSFTLPATFQHEGWLDSSTLIGGNPTINFIYTSLTAPGTLVDIGFKGLFVGTVRD